MIQEQAFKILNISHSATAGDIENAYKKLVRRYPPEFHPEKFRDLDEAYRFLTSLPRRLEQALMSHATAQVDKGIFEFSLNPPEAGIEAALKEVRRVARIAYLWKRDVD